MQATALVGAIVMFALMQPDKATLDALQPLMHMCGCRLHAMAVSSRKPNFNDALCTIVKQVCNSKIAPDAAASATFAHLAQRDDASAPAKAAFIALAAASCTGLHNQPDDTQHAASLSDSLSAALESPCMDAKLTAGAASALVEACITTQACECKRALHRKLAMLVQPAPVAHPLDGVPLGQVVELSAHPPPYDPDFEGHSARRYACLVVLERSRAVQQLLSRHMRSVKRLELRGTMAHLRLDEQFVQHTAHRRVAMCAFPAEGNFRAFADKLSWLPVDEWYGAVRDEICGPDRPPAIRLKWTALCVTRSGDEAAKLEPDPETCSHMRLQLADCCKRHFSSQSGPRLMVLMIAD